MAKKNTKTAQDLYSAAVATGDRVKVASMEADKALEEAKKMVAEYKSFIESQTVPKESVAAAPVPPVLPVQPAEPQVQPGVLPEAPLPLTEDVGEVK